MAFDPKTISPEAKSAFITLGKTFSSKDTLLQAQLTQNAYAIHGPALANHGYGPADAAELKDYMLALVSATVGRQDARAEKKSNGAAFENAFQSARNLRARTMAVARNTKTALLKTGGPAEKAASVSIQSVLDVCAQSPSDGASLATQLEQWIPLLKDTTIANAALERGGPQTLAELENTVPALRLACTANSLSKGTPANTELMDLLDGLIVENCRAARRAARSASRELGEKAIAKTFELSALKKLPKKGANVQSPVEAAPK